MTIFAISINERTCNKRMYFQLFALGNILFLANSGKKQMKHRMKLRWNKPGQHSVVGPNREKSHHVLRTFAQMAETPRKLQIFLTPKTQAIWHVKSGTYKELGVALKNTLPATCACGGRVNKFLANKIQIGQHK